MNKNIKMIIGIVVGIIIILALIHLGKNWLIPMIMKMHSGIGG